MFTSVRVAQCRQMTIGIFLKFSFVLHVVLMTARTVCTKALSQFFKLCVIDEVACHALLVLF